MKILFLFKATVKPVIFFILILSFYSTAVTAGWHEEFEEICSKVQMGDSLSREELRVLVERADKLVPLIKESTDPKKKVYIFRLKKCRSFFDFTLQMKQ